MELVEGARALLGLQPRAGEQERIERETDVGAAEATLSKLGGELAAAREKHDSTPEWDVNACRLTWEELNRLEKLVRAARRRVADLRNERDRRRHEEEHAARLKADPLLREVAESHAAAREAEERLSGVLAVLSGTERDAQGNPLPPPVGERRFLLEEQARELRHASITANARLADAEARLKARDDAARAVVSERVRGEYVKKSKAWRKNVEAAMQSLDEARRLAEQGRRVRLLLPVPGPAENMLRLWLDALARLDGQGDDAA